MDMAEGVVEVDAFEAELGVYDGALQLQPNKPDIGSAQQPVPAAHCMTGGETANIIKWYYITNPTKRTWDEKTRVVNLLSLSQMTKEEGPLQTTVPLQIPPPHKEPQLDELAGTI